jgi:hypothetical protein
MGLGADKTSYLIGGMVVTYLPMCMILPRFCETFPRKLQMIISLVGSGFTMILLGPSYTLGLP